MKSTARTARTSARRVSTDTFLVSSATTRSSATGKFRKSGEVNRFIVNSSPAVRDQIAQRNQRHSTS